MKSQKKTPSLDALLNRLNWIVHKFEVSRGNKTPFIVKDLKSDNAKRKRIVTTPKGFNRFK